MNKADLDPRPTAKLKLTNQRTVRIQSADQSAHSADPSKQTQIRLVLGTCLRANARSVDRSFPPKVTKDKPISHFLFAFTKHMPSMIICLCYLCCITIKNHDNIIDDIIWCTLIVQCRDVNKQSFPSIVTYYSAR